MWEGGVNEPRATARAMLEPHLSAAAEPEVRSFSSVDGNTCLLAGAEQEGLAHNPCSTHPPHPVYGDPWSISRSSNRGVPYHAESTLSSALKELKLQLHPNGNPVPNPRGVAVGVRASPILAPPSLSFAECRPFPRRPATGTGVPSALLRPRPAASNTPTSAALSPRRCAA